MFWRILRLPFRMLTALSKGVLAVLFLLALCLVLATASFDSVFDRVTSVVEAISPGNSVRARLDRLRVAETNRADTEARRADAAKATSDDLKARNQTLSQNNDALTATNTALKQQNDTLSQSNAGLDAQVKRLKTELAKTSVNYQGSVIPVEEAVAAATRSLADRLIATGKRHATTAEGEALPFFGIPLIAATTAQDLQDDCAMLRDLHALDVAFNPKTELGDGGICALTPPETTALWSAVKTDAQGVWTRMKGSFDGLGDLPLPDFWGMAMDWADGVVPGLTGVTVRQ